MNTRLLLTLVAPCLLLAGVASGAPPQWTGNANLALGVKLMESDWEPADEHTSFGFLVDFRRPHWPLHVAVDLLFSWQDEGDTVTLPRVGPVAVEVEGSTTELDLGVRKLWEDFAVLPALTPYAGFGAALVWARAETRGAVFGQEEDDGGLGVWAGVGAYATVAEHLNLGVDLRYSYAPVDLFEDLNAGGLRASLFAGYHW